MLPVGGIKEKVEPAEVLGARRGAGRKINALHELPEHLKKDLTAPSSRRAQARRGAGVRGGRQPPSRVKVGDATSAALSHIYGLGDFSAGLSFVGAS